LREKFPDALVLEYALGSQAATLHLTLRADASQVTHTQTSNTHGVQVIAWSALSNLFDNIDLLHINCEGYVCCCIRNRNQSRNGLL
jgi:hypothetical protein